MRRLPALLVALLLGSAAGVAVSTGPAAAAACTQGSGVTAVVGSSTSCDADGGGPAANNFTDTGHTLTRVNKPGYFVCKVDGAPSSANCDATPPADAYWALFWSDGTSGTWTYASQGAGSLTVPAGGWVAFVFQTGESRTYPAVTPIGPAPAPAPAPTKKAAEPGTTGGSSSAAPGPAPTPAPSASTPAQKSEAAKKTAAKADELARRKAATEGTPSPTAPTRATVSDPDVERASDSSGSTASLWAGAAIAVALLAGTGGLWWRRRTAGEQS